MNTYACNKAIPNSKIVTAIMIIKGNKCRKYQIPPKDNIVQANPAIIFNNVCPDIIFAKSRIDKLKTRDTYDAISMGTNRGANAICIPLGRKNPKKCSLCFFIEIILIPINNVNAKLNVTKMWLVIVKL